MQIHNAFLQPSAAISSGALQSSEIVEDKRICTIDMSHYLRNLSNQPVTAELNASKEEPISLQTFGELIDRAKRVYILAIVITFGSDKAPIPHFFDAQYLEEHMKGGRFFNPC